MAYNPDTMRYAFPPTMRVGLCYLSWVGSAD